MRIKPIFIILFISLASLGSLGLWKILSPYISNNSPQVTSDLKDTDSLIDSNVVDATSSLQRKYVNDLPVHKQKIKQYLANNDINGAINYVSDRYSELSSEQLQQLIFVLSNYGLTLNDHGELKKAQRVFSALSRVFNQVEIWDMLSNISGELKDWPTAFEALLESSLIETDSALLTSKLSSLAAIASQLKQNHQSLNDNNSVRDLYQRLYESHSSYAYFQLELALAHLKLGDAISAKSLLSAIQYDLDVGGVAKSHLTLIEQQEAEEQANKETNSTKKTNDIAVPLIRLGTSFIVNSAINGKQTRLLLDTGASITALSPELITRLRLPATGDVIRLSTANGTTESRLFLAKKISLGAITVRDLVVAEIQLGSTSHFAGLLGTDLLNKVKGNYNYLIDNKNGQLIFRTKN